MGTNSGEVLIYLFQLPNLLSGITGEGHEKPAASILNPFLSSVRYTGKLSLLLCPSKYFIHFFVDDPS